MQQFSGRVARIESFDPEGSLASGLSFIEHLCAGAGDTAVHWTRGPARLGLETPSTRGILRMQPVRELESGVSRCRFKAGEKMPQPGGVGAAQVNEVVVRGKALAWEKGPLG